MVKRWIVRTCLVFVLARAHTSQAGINVWTSNGPEGGTIHSFAIDPSNPTTLYAGTASRGIFKSTDAGGRWRPINSGLAPGTVVALAVDPGSPATVYAGTYESVFKSTDGGAAWTAVDVGFAPASLFALAVDPITPTTIYAGSGAGVSKSTDGATTWKLSNTGLPHSPVFAFGFDRTAPGTVYGVADWGLFKSTDAGDTWGATGLTNTRVGGLVVVDSTTPSALYAGTPNGAFKSTDGGGSWQLLDPNLSAAGVGALAIDPTTPQRLYIAVSPTFNVGEAFSGGGVFKSTDGGGTWSLSLANPAVLNLSLDTRTPTTLYAGTYAGIFKSMDAGSTWQWSDSGLISTNITALALDPTSATTLYAGTGDLWGSVFKSTDDGGTWSAPLVTDGPVFALAAAPTFPMTLYAGTFFNLLRSTDDGTTWRAAGLFVDDIRSFAVDPTAPTTVYGGTAGGVWKTTDGGETWKWINGGLSLTVNIAALAIEPGTPTTLYAGTSSAGVFKSTDGAATWNAVNSLADAHVRALAISANPPRTIYAGTASGVFQSSDGGGSWGAADTGLGNLDIRALVGDFTVSATLYVATAGGVFKSTDGAATWEMMDAGLGQSAPQALAMARTAPMTLYAGTAGDGVFAIQQVPTAMPTSTSPATSIQTSVVTPTPTPPATSIQTSVVTPMPTATPNITAAVTPVSARCGNGIIEADEECDDGGVCIGGANAGTFCTAEDQCAGNGVCVGGPHAEAACADDSGCPLGQCLHCVPFGGDGCARNCTFEAAVPLTLAPGQLSNLDLDPRTSGTTVWNPVLGPIAIRLRGAATALVGKVRDGQRPLVVPADSVTLPEVDVQGLACACARGVVAKTCGGTLFDTDGVTPSLDCTPGYTAGDVVCADAGKPPCAFVHGPGNVASGVIGCAGLAGVNLSVTQDSKGSADPDVCDPTSPHYNPPNPPFPLCGAPPVTEWSGLGPPGSAVMWLSGAVGQTLGTCGAMPSLFCTDADPFPARGTTMTLPFVTGTASAMILNINQKDGDTLCDCETGMPSCELAQCAGPIAVAGQPLGTCGRLDTSSPNVGGLGLAGVSTTVSPDVIIDTVLNVAPSSGPSGGTPFAYVTTAADSGVPGALAFIDTWSNAVVATVPASQYSFSVAVSPNGRFAYVSSNAGDDVIVIDTEKKTVVARIVVGSFPGDVAVSPDGRRAYVMVPRPPVVGVVVIDTTTNSVIAGTPVGDGLGALAIAPDGVVYACDDTDNTIKVVDPITNTVTAQIPVDAPPGNIAIASDGQKAYVSIPKRGEIAIVDTTKNSMIGSIRVPSRPGAIALTPDGTRAYVASLYASVMVFDLVNRSLIDTISLPPLPYGRGSGIAITPDGRFVYAVSYSDFVVGTPPLGNVSVIDVATDTITTTISMDTRAFGIAIAPPPSAPGACVGDCDGSRTVTVDEVLALVSMALGNGGSCPDGTPAGATVDISWILQAVNDALNGCSAS